MARKNRGGDALPEINNEEKTENLVFTDEQGELTEEGIKEIQRISYLATKGVVVEIVDISKVDEENSYIVLKTSALISIEGFMKFANLKFKLSNQAFSKLANGMKSIKV